MQAHGFRFCFTPLAGVLFTVPSRYSSTIGRCAYSALERGRPRFTPGCTCPALLRQETHAATRRRLRGCHALWRRFPVGFVWRITRVRGEGSPPGLSLQPHDRNGCLLGTVVVLAHPGSLATTTGMVSLPRGTEMFQFPRCPPPCGGVRQNGRVAPFGDRGIPACTRLPHAYRSHAASFIGAQRRGILRVLIVSSLLERSTSSAFCIPGMMLLICTCQGTPPLFPSGGAPSPLKRAIRAVAGGICG